MFENFREKLHIVQQDFTTGLVRYKHCVICLLSRFEEHVPHFSAGLEVLNRYEESWFLLHKRTKDCAQAAEALDGDIVMLSAHWERKRTSLTQLHEQLQSLPAFISDLDAITANIGSCSFLWSDDDMMSATSAFRASTLRIEHKTSSFHVELMKIVLSVNRRELELLEEELGSEHAQKVAELELVMQQKLRERQKVYEEAFNQDVEKYLSTGYLQNRGKIERLSGAGGGSSSLIGPDLTRCSSESSNQTSPPNDQLSNKDVFWQPEEELVSQASDEPLVQSDEEDIHPDMALVGLHDLGTLRGSDDSDSSADLRTGTYALGKA
ncbi:dysbindin-A-like [Neolamprologus brichardi]|uniref:dysbindin-A-like n=1 Tax=Neolamprologus brichardi TaxID=32507 RepID=UPI001643D1A9|nr:dysbindin-A-like [Neolamprologus brichardi]